MSTKSFKNYEETGKCFIVDYAITSITEIPEGSTVCQSENLSKFMREATDLINEIGFGSDPMIRIDAMDYDSFSIIVDTEEKAVTIASRLRRILKKNTKFEEDTDSKGITIYGDCEINLMMDDSYECFYSDKVIAVMYPEN